MNTTTIERFLSLCQKNLLSLKFVLCQALIELIQKHIEKNLYDSEPIRIAEKTIARYRNIQSQIQIDVKGIQNDKRISEWMSRKPEDIDNALKSVDALLPVFDLKFSQRVPWRMDCAHCAQSVWEVVRPFTGRYQRNNIDSETCCFGPETNTVMQSIPFLRCFCKISHSWKTHFVDRCDGLSRSKQQQDNPKDTWMDYMKREPQQEAQ